MEHEWSFDGGVARVAEDDEKYITWEALGEGGGCFDNPRMRRPIEVFARETLRLRQDNDALRAVLEVASRLAREVVFRLLTADILVDDLRDVVAECGLGTIETYDPNKHGEMDAGEGDTVWLLTPLAKQLLGRGGAW